MQDLPRYQWQPPGVAVTSVCTAVCSVKVWDLGFMENSEGCIALHWIALHCTALHWIVVASSPLGLADGNLDHTSSPPTQPPCCCHPHLQPQIFLYFSLLDPLFIGSSKRLCRVTARFQTPTQTIYNTNFQNLFQLTNSPLFSPHLTGPQL